MNRTTVANELVKIAKELSAADTSQELIYSLSKALDYASTLAVGREEQAMRREWKKVEEVIEKAIRMTETTSSWEKRLSRM